MRPRCAALSFPTALALAFSALAGAAEAQGAACAADLAAADRLVSAVQARDKDFTEHDDVKNCRLWRQNRADMLAADEAMKRCLTGRDREENVGQLEASLEDIAIALAKKCR